ncbi:MAG: DUF1295 domain-containing protein [Planctomycetaceae bacterium]
MTILLGWAGAAAVFAALWAVQRRTRNATSVDVAWAAVLGGLAILYAGVTPGPQARRLVVGCLACVWAMRLAFHLWSHRVRRAIEEDGRYASMRSHWGERAQRNFFFFYQGQALVAVLFSVPFLAAMGRAGALDAWDVSGIALAVVAVFGEGIADRQLAAWRSNPAHRGRTCRAGLWRTSRHPNYFFEWVHWWAYVLLGGGAWVTWLGPILMLLFLFKLTGIPYTEKQALKSRGDDYRAYQETTSVFFPWFPSRKRS